jgi:hypothetical protein
MFPKPKPRQNKAMKFRRSLFVACSSSLALVCLAFPTAHAGTTWDGGGNATTNIDV